MENLDELIDRLVPEIEQRGSGVTKKLLLKRAQISENQLRGSLVAPEVLRTIAGLLDCPYAVVLGAALHGAGYVDSSTDLLSGHSSRGGQLAVDRERRRVSRSLSCFHRR